ncbi:unnamed protein product [Phytomonas sp. Hart1]|nr:unnamed protein product [Phytomonas sp. Hart1]|eukprot:CCW70634.1 unnamed protein product [Phytomonas sp. isolate Hart1]
MYEGPSIITNFVQNSYYKEAYLDFKPVHADPVDHLLPFLEEPSAAVENTLNALTLGIAEEMRGNGADVKTFPVRWRDQTAEQMRGQLLPMVSHYKIQGLLVQERTCRLAIEVSQFTFRHNLMSAFNYTASLSQRLSVHSAQMQRQRETLPFNSYNYNKFFLSLPNTSRWSETPNEVSRSDHEDVFFRHSSNSDEEVRTGSTSFPSHSRSFSPSLPSPVYYEETLYGESETQR